MAFSTIVLGIEIAYILTYYFLLFNQVVIWNHESLPTSGAWFFGALTVGQEPS
jgi:hypothetical protein